MNCEGGCLLIVNTRVFYYFMKSLRQSSISLLPINFSFASRILNGKIVG